MNNEIAIQDDRAILAAEMEQDPERERMTLAEWYLAQECKDDAMEEMVKRQAERMLSAINARRRAREWKWGNAFRTQVEQDLAEQKGKKKSVKYMTGTAGFRTVQGKVHIKDASQFKDWAVANLPDALTLEIHVTPVKKHIEANGEVPPGIEWQPPREKFYPGTEPPRLGGVDGTQDGANGLPETT